MDLIESELTELREFREEFENDVAQQDAIAENQPRILPKDHPLLAKFQKTLNSYLLRVKNKIQEEIAELDFNLQAKEKERADFGAHLYDLQQNVKYQRTQIDKLSQQILETSNQRLEKESSISQLKSIYEAKNYMHKDAKQHYNERLQEIDNLQVMENALSKWTQEVQDEVDVAKRVVNKDAIMQSAISDEKKMMDWFIHNLDGEVRRREAELVNVNDQIDEQNGLIAGVNSQLASVNADLETLYQEHKKLTGAWNEVILSIQQKDKQLQKKKDKLDTQHQEGKVLHSKIDMTKKATQKALEEFRRISRFKDKIVEELQTVEKNLKKNEYDYEIVTGDLEHYTNILEQTEQDLQQANTEGLLLTNRIKALKLTIEKQNKKKFELEEKVLELLQDQISTDKARQGRLKKLREAQDKRRNVEITLATIENKLSVALLELEKWRGNVDRSNKEATNIRLKYKLLVEESSGIKDEIHKIQNTITSNHRQLDTLSKKLEKLISDAGGQELNPDELKLIDVQKSIKEVRAEVTEAQALWLRIQMHVVLLTEKRGKQVNDINLTRGQLMIISQKTQKIETKLQQMQLENKNCVRSIAKKNNELFMLNSKYAEKKKIHEINETECEISHKEITFKLKDAETMIVNLEQDLCDISNEIQETKDEVMRKHDETLAWETKFKFAVEAKKFQDEEQSQNSEIWAMKTEIHRMEVRYGELKRAQEKLIRDLDNTVHHREHTFDAAMASEKLVGKSVRSRSITQHKISEMENKFKSISSEIKKIEKALARLREQQTMMDQDLCGKQQKIDQEKLDIEEMQGTIERNMLLKQQNLDNIVRKQHRAKRYRELVCNTKLPKIRSDCVVHCETQRQNEMNEHLSSITETLQQEFPGDKFELTKIQQTLRN